MADRDVISIRLISHLFAFLKSKEGNMTKRASIIAATILALNGSVCAGSSEVVTNGSPVQVAVIDDHRSDLITKRVIEASSLSTPDAPQPRADMFVPIPPVTVAITEQARTDLSAPADRSSIYGTSNIPAKSAVHCQDGEIDPATVKSMIEIEAERQNADAKLALAIADQESGFGANVNSSAGARGIMQLMPATAAHYGVINICDAAQNIRGGIAFLKDLNTTFGGNIMLMIAAYNSGEDRVLKTGGIPSISETVNYTARVTNAYYGFDNTLKGGKRANTNVAANNLAQQSSGVTELPVQNISDGSPIPINQPKTATTKSGGLADRQQWIGGSVLYVQ